MFANILAVLPAVITSLLAPLLTPAFIEKVAKRAILRGLSKAVKMTKTTADDEVLEMVGKVWGEKNGD